MIMSLILILILYCYYHYYYKENVVFIVNKALLFLLAFVKCVIAEIQVYTLTLGLQKISLRCKIGNVGWDGWWMLTIGMDGTKAKIFLLWKFCDSFYFKPL